MSEVLEKINIERTENCYKLTIRQSFGKDLWYLILYAGLLWFAVIMNWKLGGGSFPLYIWSLMQLIIIYCLLLAAFGKNTLVVNSDDVTIKRIEFSFIPRIRKLKIKVSEIDKVFCKKDDEMTSGYDFCLQLKSGEVVNIASKITMKDDSVASTAVKIIDNSLRRFQLPLSER